MDFYGIGIGIVILILVHKLILAPLRHLLGNVVVGLLLLYGVNYFGYLLGLAHVPITLITGILVGIFGLPAVAVLTLFYTFF
jgi:inhibitor of the pro-sigma K processing machinery